MSDTRVKPSRTMERADSAVTARPPKMSMWLVISCVFFLIAVPVAIVVSLGGAPFEEIRLDFPGFDVAITTTVLTAGANLGSMVSIGALMHVMFLRADPRKRAKIVSERFEIRILQLSASLWAVSAAFLVIFVTLDRNGAPLAALGTPQAFPVLFRLSYAPMAWTVSLAAAAVVLFASYFAHRWMGMLIPLWASAISILAPVVTGQVLVGPNHDFGGDAAVFQTIAAYALFGCIIVAAFRVASGRLLHPVTLRRLFFVAIVALPVILLSELVITWFKLAGSSPVASLTGVLLLISTCSVIVVALSVYVAWSLSRRAKLQARNVSGLLTIAATAVFAWLGAAVSMTRQPPPQYFVPTSITEIFLGFDVDDEPTALVLFTHWRPNLLFLGIAFVAIAVYLLAVRELRQRGDQWPAGRTLAWILGWSVVVFATSSGFGKYSAPDFGIHMIVHMSLNMLGPGLMVMGGVVTLLLRATRSNPHKPAGVHDWINWILQWRVAHFLYNPLIVFVLFIGSYYGLYLTGLFGELMRFHWAHQFMNLHFLIVGYLYYSLIIGVDRPPRPLPHIGKLGYVLAAMPFHAFFGVILMTSGTIVAESFYLYLNLPWADLQAQQYLAGGVAWAGGEIPLLIVIAVLSVQWGRQDAKEARRLDRHLDTGRDDEFDVYNEMLARLSERDQRRVSPPPVVSKAQERSE